MRLSQCRHDAAPVQVGNSYWLIISSDCSKPFILFMPLRANSHNMKRKLALLILFQSVFTILQVYLISKISLLGRIGISIAYKEYKFLRSGWKLFLLLMAVQLLIIGLLNYGYKKLVRRTYFKVIGAVVIVAMAGLWATYNDFTHTFSHRLLKEPFHLGFYLFWLGISATCIFFAMQPAKVLPLAER